MFAYKKERDGYFKWMMGNLASGGAAGATSLLFVYSLDYARTRLANDAKSASKGGGDRQFNGLVDVYRKTLASDGIAGLYRGFGPSVLGIVVYRGLYFGMYDSIKPVLLVGPLEGNFLASFMLGWGVTTGAGIASYPLDTIRRRMMMTSGEAVKYKGSMDAARQIMAAEGVRSFFKGAGANILRGVAGAGVLSIYDQVQLLMFGKAFKVSYPARYWLFRTDSFTGWFRLNASYFDIDDRNGLPRTSVAVRNKRCQMGCCGELSVGKRTRWEWGALVKRCMDAANRHDLATYTLVFVGTGNGLDFSCFRTLGCGGYSFSFPPECVVPNPNCTLLPSYCNFAQALCCPLYSCQTSRCS